MKMPHICLEEHRPAIGIESTDTARLGWLGSVWFSRLKPTTTFENHCINTGAGEQMRLESDRQVIFLRQYSYLSTDKPNFVLTADNNPQDIAIWEEE